MPAAPRLARKPPPSFSVLFSIGPVQETLFAALTRPQLLLKVRTLNREGRDWVDAEFMHVGWTMRPVDMPIRARLLRHFVCVEGARVVLPAAVYALEGDTRNAAHLLNEPRGEQPEIFDDKYFDEPECYGEAHGAWEEWEPEWRAGFGPLVIAAGVTMVGAEGVVLNSHEYRDGWMELQHTARLVVETEDVNFVSMHLPNGAEVKTGGSLTMTKCTSTGEYINVYEGASLVMEDSRVYSNRHFGVVSYGDLKATRCTFEDSGNVGVFVSGHHNSVQLVDCVIRKNGWDGVNVFQGKATLRGGTVSENKGYGVRAYNGGMVTVAKAEEGQPQTVSKDNKGNDWGTEGGDIIGIPQEKINV